MMNLASSQRALQQALMHGDEAILSEIVAAPPISPRQRLQVYGDAYFLRLIEALRANFPKLHWVLGDEGFALLGRAFTRAHPSTTPSIRWFGARLPGFLQTAKPFADQPILAELACFEWLLSLAFDAADAPSVQRSTLSERDANRWGSIRMRFHPSLRRAEFHWNTVAVWHAADAERDAPAPARADAATPWLIWRQEFQNYFRSLDSREALAIDLATGGASFADICASLAAAMPEDEVPLYAVTLLSTWADSGIIASIE